MQNAEFKVGSGGGVVLWRGIPAQITISGVEDTSGNWLFLVDNNYSDGAVLAGAVAADNGALVVTLSEMNTVELANAIEGRAILPCRATLTDGASRVYIIPFSIRNRAVEGTPTPVAEYYTKAQIDELISGQIDLDYSVVTNKPTINGVTLTGNMTASELGLANATVIIFMSGLAIPIADNVIYRHTLAAGDEISFDTTELARTSQFTFEVHLYQPATPVTFTLPTGVLWADGDEFSSVNAAPTMNEGSTKYCLVFRWDGDFLLGNLAYKVRGVVFGL